MEQMLVDCILGRSMWSRPGTPLLSGWVGIICFRNARIVWINWLTPDWSQQTSNSSLQNVGAISPVPTCYRNGCPGLPSPASQSPNLAQPGSGLVWSGLITFMIVPCSALALAGRGLKFRRKRNIFLLPKPNQAVTLSWAVCIKCGKMVKYGTWLGITEIYRLEWNKDFHQSSSPPS